MAIRQYIGARYVPKYYGIHNMEVSYEPLSIVNDSVGNSYTSKKFVPIGTALSNTEYWILSANTSGAVTALTEAVTDLDGRVNVIDGEVAEIQTVLERNLFTTPEDFGAVGDGVTDDTDALQAALDSGKTLVLPAKTYKITDTLRAVNNIIGIASPRLGGTGSVILCDFTGEKVSHYAIEFTYGSSTRGIEFKSFAIACRAVANGIDYAPGSGNGRPACKIEDIAIWDCYNRGLAVRPEHTVSRCLYASELSITGGKDGGIGIEINANANDCRFSDIEIMYLQKGILTYAMIQIDTCHIYTGRANIAQLDVYWGSSMCIEAYASVMGDNLYLDSALQCFVQRTGSSNLGTVRIWFDNYMQGATNKGATLIRAVDSSARINIDNLLVGGNAEYMGFLTSAYCRVNNIVTTFTAIPGLDNSYNQSINPLMHFRGRSFYNYYGIDGANYVRVATVFMYNGNTVEFTLTSHNRATNVIVNKSSTTGTPTVQGRAVGSAPTQALYYKISGNFIEFYAQTTTPVCVNQLVCSKDGESATSWGALIDFEAMPNLAQKKQGSTSGLTAVTIS